MSDPNYRAVWDRRSGDGGAALNAVNNSASEAVARATGGWAAAQLRAALDLRPGDTLLELGCGAGRIARELAGECSAFVGVDISPNMIQVAGQRLSEHANVRLELLDRTDLHMIESASVDKAYTMAVLCHMDKEDLYLYLRELARVIRPGGLAYLETWNLADPTGWQRWLAEVEQWNRSDQNQRKDVARNQFCVPGEFQLYAERAGLQPLACFRDSPWIQLIVGKDLDAAAIEAERNRLAAARAAIAYSPLFARLFWDTVQIIYGRRHPREVLAELDERPESPEIELFRVFVRGLWEAEPERFGEFPSGPS